MSLPVRLSTQAEQDLREIVGYYQTRQANLGLKFANKLEQLLTKIEKFPELYGYIW